MGCAHFQLSQAGDNSMTQLGASSTALADDSGCECERCEKVSEVNVFGCPCMELERVEGVGIMSECGPSCGCGLQCGNRVSQSGIGFRLKIVRNIRKGWALYAAQLIQQGQFVCEYAGTSYQNLPFIFSSSVTYTLQNESLYYGSMKML